jgi:hypothetical protein
VHHRVIGEPQRHRRQARADRAGEARICAARQDHGQRAWPELRGQQAGTFVEVREPLGPCQVGYMDNQRVEIGPPFGAVDSRDRVVAVCPCGEAVDGLGGHRDQSPTADQLRRRRYAGFIRRADLPSGLARQVSLHRWFIVLCRIHGLSL